MVMRRRGEKWNDSGLEMNEKVINVSVLEHRIIGLLKQYKMEFIGYLLPLLIQ